jgi:hypothetical protein
MSVATLVVATHRANSRGAYRKAGLLNVSMFIKIQRDSKSSPESLHQAAYPIPLSILPGKLRIAPPKKIRS